MLWGMDLLKKIEKSSVFIDQPTLTKPSFTVYSHQSDTLTDEKLDDIVYVAHFFDPTCEEPCLPRLRAIRDAQYAVSKFKHFRILSHCQQPVENQNQIWSFARKISNFPSWQFVYTDTSEIADLITDYGLSERNFAWGSPEDVALIDMQGNVRGYYNPVDSSGFRNLVNDIVYLLRHD
ncbi:MAG: protein SCO1/2 [Limisphaerales bacterium]|jgi:protein SCO1/2